MGVNRIKTGYKSTIFCTLLLFVGMVSGGCGNNIATMSSGSEQEKVEMQTEPTEATTEATAEVVESEVILEESTQPEETVEEKNIVTFTISAAGDVTLGNTHMQDYSYSFRQMYDTQQDQGYFFKNVKSYFEADDMTIVNFEGVLTLSEERQERTYNMKGNPEYVSILTEGSVEAVSFGNNHRQDYGQRGSDDTIAAFREADIGYAYNNNVGIYEANGITVGWVSVNEASYGDWVEKDVEQGIQELKEAEVDIILVCCHWGTERENYPEEYQTTLGRKCIDWGADLVLGHHPHVLQGIEEYQGKYIVYSLANFCYGGNRNPKDKDTMIFQQTFTFVDGEKQEDKNIRIIPCSLSSVTTVNNYQPTPAEGEEAMRIVDRINLYSKTYEVAFDYEGYLIEMKD